jgi:alpha-mannosidase
VNSGTVLAGHVGGDLIVVNPTSFHRSDLAFWQGELPPDKFLSLPDGTPVPVQPAPGGVWIDAGELPPFSATPLSFGDGRSPRPETGLTVSRSHLENRYLRVEFDGAGDIVRIYDKVNRRELLPPGAVANQFQAFEDRPLNFDAWDIDIFFEDKMWTPEPATEIEVVESGPLRATVLVRRRILGSEYTQRISLSYNSPRLDFDTVIDWRERHVLLKVAFPVDVLSPVATYDIQWGNIERPTHRNTSWDWARFEVPAQKWVDLSEGDYGVSLLNDCKYGHDVHDNVLRLTLLRSPTMPDPEADLGEHRFSYSLFPHAGRWDHRTVGEAYALNDPLIVIRGKGEKPPSGAISWFRVSSPGVVIETVKQAEDGNGIIVRLYEYRRSRGMVSLSTGFELEDAWRTNLLEEDAERLDHSSKEVRFPVKPYEIVTLRLLPGN